MLCIIPYDYVNHNARAYKKAHIRCETINQEALSVRKKIFMKLDLFFNIIFFYVYIYVMSSMFVSL